MRTIVLNLRSIWVFYFPLLVHELRFHLRSKQDGLQCILDIAQDPAQFLSRSISLDGIRAKADHAHIVIGIPKLRYQLVKCGTGIRRFTITSLQLDTKHRAVSGDMYLLPVQRKRKTIAFCTEFGTLIKLVFRFLAPWIWMA